MGSGELWGYSAVVLLVIASLMLRKFVAGTVLTLLALLWFLNT
jgi:hypothetical protein